MTDSHDPEFLSQALAHVYWIGGSPCSGKTSIAKALVERYGLRYYDCDHAFYRHNEIVPPEHQPVFYRVMRLAPEALWMRPVQQQTAEEIAIYREEFPLILKDLLALPSSQPVLAEGAALLPECVAPLLRGSPRAIWIVPEAQFQLYHYSRREWINDVVKDTSNPVQAFQNWMERDICFARLVRQEAQQRRLPVLVVDGKNSLAENTRLVEKFFWPGEHEQKQEKK
jgi:hypothetical protein